MICVAELFRRIDVDVNTTCELRDVVWGRCDEKIYLL